GWLRAPVSIAVGTVRVVCPVEIDLDLSILDIGNAQVQISTAFIGGLSCRIVHERHEKVVFIGRILEQCNTLISRKLIFLPVQFKIQESKALVLVGGAIISGHPEGRFIEKLLY